MLKECHERVKWDLKLRFFRNAGYKMGFLHCMGLQFTDNKTIQNGNGIRIEAKKATDKISCPGALGFSQIWAGLGWAGLGWVGLGWVGLGWVGLGWAGPCPPPPS